MKTLLILRHAKSSWDNANMSDHERPLNKRGIRDAPRMAGLLDELQITPDLIICSTAERARQTTQLIVDQLEQAIEVHHTNRLYLAPPQECVRVIQEHADGEDCVMIVAHNPGLEDLVGALSGQSERMPTAALARFNANTDSWSDFSFDTPCQLVHVYRPKEVE